MKIYEGSKWIDWETKDAACWLAAKTGLTREAAKHAIIANLDPTWDGDYDDTALEDLALIILDTDPDHPRHRRLTTPPRPLRGAAEEGSRHA